MAINYEEIIEQLDDERVKQLLDKLNISYIDKSNYLLLKTVCHHATEDDASWKLYYYKNTHIFYCYSNCQAMSPFTFLKHFYESQNREYDWFTDIYELILGCSYFDEDITKKNSYKPIRSDYELFKDRHELPAYPNEIMEAFIKYYPIEWLNDGIAKETMDKFNIRFSPSQNKIIIPHYDAHGRLVGIRGRALDSWEIENVGKYMPIQMEGKWYSHPLSLNLYGLNWTKENIKQTGIAYIGEAEKFVLQCDSFNMPNCAVAVCGNKLNKYALDILTRECHPQEIVICFDNEEEPHSQKYFNYLFSICNKYKVYANFSFIYDKEHLLKLKDSPSDRGEDVFRQLLERRVRI